MTPLPHRNKSKFENVVSVCFVILMAITICAMIWFMRTLARDSKDSYDLQRACEQAHDFYYQGMCFKPNSIVTNP